MITATAIVLYVIGLAATINGLVGMAVSGIDYPWPHNRQAMVILSGGLVALFAASILWKIA